jgi:hypothetical protein
MKIIETTDYSKFKLTADNRQTVERRVLKLIPSMRKYGWLASHPMLVRKDGDKYEILDGQGRFHAAKQLGIPARYVVTDADVSIPEINAGQCPWNMQDYVGSYAQQGNPAYHFLKQFSERHKLPLSQCAQILRGGIAIAGNANRSVKNGTFECADVEFAERVAVIVSALARAHPCGRNSHAVNAVSRIAQVDALDIHRMIDRIDKNQDLVSPKTTCDGYVEMLETIYNFASKSGRLPLAFLSKELMAKRRSTFGREGKRKGK